MGEGEGLEGGEDEAKTLNGELGGTTSRILQNKGAKTQKAPKQRQARAEGKRIGSSILKKAMATEEGNFGASGTENRIPADSIH